MEWLKLTPGINIITSNRLEVLIEHLAGIVEQPLSDPFVPEIIVVQSKGMERWVSMELARLNNICANCYFPFPNRILHDLVRKMAPEIPETSLFDNDILTFRLMKILPECLENPEFITLNAYLKNDSKGLKLFQLSQKIADTFDQYQIFRPDMLFEWEKGREDHWQAVLWRKLSGGIEKQHRAWLRAALLKWIRASGTASWLLPERMSIFGISYLPPFHMQVFAAIAERIPVNFYLMNPSRQYWADILSEKEMSRIKARHAASNVDTETALHLESGNRLLASLGMLGRDFFRRISANDYVISELFKDPGEDNLLARIQSNILDLKESLPDSCLKPEEPTNDRSIEIHSCHSPMREVEVLYDHLLDMFESEPDLLPKDIIVMTPDIESYVPFIQAVFDNQDNSDVRIPFSIADQSLKKESRVIEAFFSILSMNDKRFGVARVLSLLDFDVIREALALSENEIETIDYWLKDTNVRWGRDAASRRSLGFDGFSENTWKAGLERLLLGYAMPGHDQHMFNGLLPYDHIEGQDRVALGKLFEFTHQLFHFIDEIEEIKNLDGWRDLFNKILEQFIVTNDARDHEIQILKKVLDELSATQSLSAYQQEVSFEIVRSYIEHQLQKENLGFGFISGGVTFCAMLPMRSIPFKVICLIGMNSDGFPRENRPLSFDFIANKPQPGDRSQRSDDKYLFLEALISARNKFYLSYVGQNIMDNSLLPPSVLVSELIDHIHSEVGISEDAIVTCHPLQAFSPSYFTGNKNRFSYSEENLMAATQMADSIRMPKSPPVFWPARFSIAPEEIDKWKNIDIKDFCEFWVQPATFLLQRRLGIYLQDEQLLPEERENFDIEPLDKFLIGQKMVANRIDAKNMSNLLPLLRAQGRLPIGSVGQVIFQKMDREADDYAKKVLAYTAESPLSSREINVEIDGFNISGSLEGIHPSGMIHFRYARMRAKYVLWAWVHHLIAGTLPENKLTTSILVCKDAIWKFNAVDNPGNFLCGLLERYWQGITEPLHFFPETSYEYALQRLQKGKSNRDALTAARKKWTADEFSWGELQNPYYELIFSRLDPFGNRFIETAEFVFAPVFKYGSMIKSH